MTPVGCVLGLGLGLFFIWTVSLTLRTPEGAANVEQMRRFVVCHGIRTRGIRKSRSDSYR